MKKEMFMIRLQTPSGTGQEILVYGYKSNVRGLAITIHYSDAECGVKSYSLTHIQSGIGFFQGRFSSIRKANNIIATFLSDSDWSRPVKVIQADQEVIAAYGRADRYSIEQYGR